MLRLIGSLFEGLRLVPHRQKWGRQTLGIWAPLSGLPPGILEWLLCVTRTENIEEHFGGCMTPFCADDSLAPFSLTEKGHCLRRARRFATVWYRRVHKPARENDHNRTPATSWEATRSHDQPYLNKDPVPFSGAVRGCRFRQEQKGLIPTI